MTNNRDAALLRGEQLSKQLVVTQNELETALRDMTAASEERDSLTGSLTERHSEIANANGQVENLTRRITELTAQVEDARSSRTDAQEITQALDLELEALGNRRDEAVWEANGLSKTVETLETEVKIADESVKTASSVIGELETSLASKDAQLDETQARGHNLQAELERLKSEMDTLHTRELPAALEQKVQALKQVQKMRAEIEMLRNQL